MIVIDANLLLYAYDDSSPNHAAASAWLEGVLAGDEAIRIPLISALAFVRIGTNPSVFHQPMTPADAIGIVEEWLGQPGVELASPTARHWTTLIDLARGGQARGPLVMDAHVAALTIEHGGVLFTTDRDFARFEGLKFRNPMPS